MKLPLLQVVSTSLLLLQAAQSTTLPKDKGKGPVEGELMRPVMPMVSSSQDVPAGKPIWECWYEKRVVHNRYHLQGSNWNMTEDEVKSTCRKADAMTNWKWTEAVDATGVQKFNCEFSLAIKTAERLENSLSNAMYPLSITFPDMKKFKCPSYRSKVHAAGLPPAPPTSE